MTKKKASSRSYKEKIGREAVIAAGIGNFLEFFDFGIYTVFAIIIGDLFFPSQDPAVSLLISVTVFSVGFLMRPLGGLILGAYSDRHGRKSAMLITIVLMALGSALIGFAPPYATIGLSASVMIVIGRLLQGFSAGGEAGASAALLVESAGAGKKGAFVRWQYVTQALASITGAAFGAFLFWALPKEDLYAWGWRIPFVFALLIVPVGFYIRKNIDETFEGKHKLKGHPFSEIIKTMPCQFIATIGMIIPVTIPIYIVLKYMPLYLQQVTTIAPWIIYLATMFGFASEALGSFVGGHIYDRVESRKKFFITVISICIVLITAMFASITIPVLFFILMFMAAFLIGVMATVETTLVIEAFPPEVRTTGMAVSHSVGTAVFGGTAQIIVTKLLAVSGGNPMAPLWYLLPMLITGIGFCILFREKRYLG